MVIWGKANAGMLFIVEESINELIKNVEKDKEIILMDYDELKPYKSLVTARIVFRYHHIYYTLI